MSKIRIAAARLGLGLILTVAPCCPWASGSSQDNHPSDQVNNLGVACSQLPSVSVEKGKPFTADQVVSSSDQRPRQSDVVARDSAGRIYKHHNVPWQSYAMSSQRDANTIMALGEIFIYDCFGGKVFYLLPGSRSASITQSCENVPSFPEPVHPYSYSLVRFLDVKAPNGSAEGLGTKEFNGFEARGIRTTWLGNEKDGEWMGKPLRTREEWRSDSLGATLLVVTSDSKTKVNTQTALTNIRTVEPAASLFEIPADYKIKMSPKDALRPPGAIRSPF